MAKGFFTVVASVLLSGLTAFGIVKAATPQQNGIVYSKEDGESPRTVNLSVSDYPDFTYAAEHAVEAVVYVKVTIKYQQQYQMIDPFFRFFFGDEGQPQTREQERQGSGSGVIIRPDGYIVTNNHVVQNATSIEVTLNNNKTYPATVIGTDPATDVALIKIDAAGLPTLKFADSDKLRLGEWVLAIGSPLGEELRSTITAGIVSAKGRSMPNYNGEFKIESFIQTDAAVNPGNSGGALVNKAGELVGINTAIISTTGSYTGYSFAVPSNIVSKIVSDLIDFGSVKRARLGVTMSPVTDKIAKDMNLPSLDGVYVNEVAQGSAADQAGIKKEDVIIQVDSTLIKSPSDLQVVVNNFHPGDKALVTVIRDGKAKQVEVQFQGTSEITGTVGADGSVAFYGARIGMGDKGVTILSAGSGKLAQAGGEDGFVIQFVNDQRVNKPQDVIDTSDNLLAGVEQEHVVIHLVLCLRIREVLKQRRSAIILVPEISLTPQTVGWFHARFGDLSAVIHSGLSAGERFDEWQRIRKGDQAALEKLTRANLRFVVSVAKQYQNQGLSLPDLINEGNLGLIKAAEKFDETRGFKFISYAVWWIRQSILQALAEQSRIVRLPLNQVGSLNKINKALGKFEQENERQPSAEELSEMIDVPKDKIADTLRVSGRHVSVDDPFVEGEDNSLLDVLPNDDSPSADKGLTNESLSTEIERALQILTPREREIIKSFFGIGCQEMTLEEIGERLDLTRERVRQIKEKAIRKLKKPSASKLLKSYLG